MSEERKTDVFGVLLGAAVFLLGIGFLVFTFIQAALLFQQPAGAILSKANPDVTEIGVSFGHVVLQFGYLLVMSIAGSVISSRGIKMYLAARAGVGISQERP